MSKEEAAAICIQAHFRGYLARKLFVQLLYEKFIKVGQIALIKRSKKLLYQVIKDAHWVKQVNTVHQISKDQGFIIISLVQATVWFKYLFSSVHVFVTNLLCFACHTNIRLKQNFRTNLAKLTTWTLGTSSHIIQGLVYSFECLTNKSVWFHWKQTNSELYIKTIIYV